mgnify:FL=1
MSGLSWPRFVPCGTVGAVNMRACLARCCRRFIGCSARERGSLRRLFQGWFCAFLTGIALSAAAVQPALPLKERILLKPRSEAAETALEHLHAVHEARIERRFHTFGGIQVVQVPPGINIDDLLHAYRSSGLVEFAERDNPVRAEAVFPNDPAFESGLLWGLHNLGQEFGVVDADIDAPEAWELRTAASNIVVAVLDTGIRWTHEDLASNVWVNPLDGTHGYNAFDDSLYPMDDQGHGTQVAGVIGAVGNNGVGVAGVAWRVQLMACKCLDNWGNGQDSTVIAALEFALTNGARVVSASLSGAKYSTAMSNAVFSLREAGVILVAAAGNNAGNVDVLPRFPACYDIDNIVSVAYTTREDALGPFSNYGATNVDLAAPGEEIYSTHASADDAYYPTNFPHQHLFGTSFAAAYVSGAVALILERFPGEPHQKTIQRLLDGVDPLPDLQGKCVSGGRLNLRGALSTPIRLLPVASEPGERTFRVQCGFDRTCVIEMSPDLFTWLPVLTNSTTTNTWFEFTDPAADSPGQRFFRVRAEP